jgi:hypothetical protein
MSLIASCRIDPSPRHRHVSQTVRLKKTSNSFFGSTVSIRTDLHFNYALPAQRLQDFNTLA